jgi:hypothetical protein
MKISRSQWVRCFRPLEYTDVLNDCKHMFRYWSNSQFLYDIYSNSSWISRIQFTMFVSRPNKYSTVCTLFEYRIVNDILQTTWNGKKIILLSCRTKALISVPLNHPQFFFENHEFNKITWTVGWFLQNVSTAVHFKAKRIKIRNAWRVHVAPVYVL